MNNRRTGFRNLWFQVSIVFGALLGVGLLVQTLATYHYVSKNLIRQEAQRDARRKLTSLDRELRSGGAKDPAQLTAVVDELRRESAQQIAWIRIIASDGALLASSGNVPADARSAQGLRTAFDRRETNFEIRDTESGKVLVQTFPIRLGRPDPQAGQQPRTPPPIAQIALYSASVAAPFGGLQVNLIIGCSAAIALLCSMVVIGLRFGGYVRGKQLEQELELARRVQRDLLPATGSLGNELDCAAECIPAWQVGGDFYDVFPVEHGQVAMVLGDVSGKGLSAALLMSLMHGAVRASSWVWPSANQEEAAQRLNQLLCAKSASGRFASLFWSYYDPQAAILRYVNAGHLPPMIVRRKETGDFECFRLEEGGPVVGALPNAVYRQGLAEVRPGDLLVVFSDGIVEAEDSHEQEFGEGRLLEAVRENWGRSSEEICAAILGRMRSFVGDRQPFDDQTLLVVRLQPAPRTAKREEDTTVSACA